LRTEKIKIFLLKSEQLIPYIHYSLCTYSSHYWCAMRTLPPQSIYRRQWLCLPCEPAGQKILKIHPTGNLPHTAQNTQRYAKQPRGYGALTHEVE
jgi:hypothetical protein